MNKALIVNQFYVTNKQLRNLNLFGTGFLIYSAGYIISGTPNSNFIICQLLQSLSLFLIIPTTINLIRFEIENQQLKLLFVIYFIWSLLIIIRGFQFNYSSIKQMLFDPLFGIFSYFVPLIIFFPKKLDFYKKLFDVIIIFGILAFLYDIVFFKYLVSSDRGSILSRDIIENTSGLVVPCGFILFTHGYHSNKTKLIALGVIILALLFAIYKARRTYIFMCSSTLMVAYFLYLFSSKRKIIVIYLSLLTLLIGIFYVNRLYNVNKSIFGYLVERGDVDTRTGVELYFYDDMRTKDWIIGRGINGEYYCPGIEEDGVTSYRGVIETGFLQTVLKGGLISLGLFLFITIPAILKGLFDSKNTLSKAAALWILLGIIYSYPTIIQGFSLYYLIVWISIGICYSKSIRYLPESSVIGYFNDKTIKN